jgi:hypothetical protein
MSFSWSGLRSIEALGLSRLISCILLHVFSPFYSRLVRLFLQVLCLAFSCPFPEDPPRRDSMLRLIFLRSIACFSFLLDSNLLSPVILPSSQFPSPMYLNHQMNYFQKVNRPNRSGSFWFKPHVSGH